MRVEHTMSEQFRNYAIENCTKKITAIKVVQELLRNSKITKPINLKVAFCSIADLKYNGKCITGASMNIVASKIFLEIWEE